MRNDRRASIKAEADRLQSLFVAAGALPVEAAGLQPADTLLDLYGEDIRARAYVTHDPVAGEQMMRPDFTVPVVEMHMAEGAEPARYTYNGPVWRKQQEGSARASETLQVGFELFDRADPAAADAEVFALFAEILAPLGLRAATGDIGILLAAVGGLATTERRKAALLRHLWRPARFRALLERFGGLTPVPASRAALLESCATQSIEDLVDAAAPAIGLRGRDEVISRIQALQKDQQTAPIAREEVDLIEGVLALRGHAQAALAELRGLQTQMAGLQQAVDRMEARLSALERRGIDTSTLDFEVSYGRTTLEYYDGFVFGFFAEGRDDLPAIASGGRYDALTRVLGNGRSIPAVGGVIRPEFVVELAKGRP